MQAAAWADTAAPRWFTPRDLTAPTYGPHVGKVARDLGMPLMPWQRLVSETTGELNTLGRFRYPLSIILVPRRAGKTGLTLPTAIQRVSIAPGSRGWYTAQTGGDAGAVFREEWDPIVKASPLNSLVKARLSNGSQGFTLPGNRKLGIFAPTRKALHGKSADFVTVDETWAFSAEEGEYLEAALRPTMLTRPMRQVFYISAGGTDESTWLLQLRELGRATVEAGLCEQAGLYYAEWHPAIDAEGQVAEDLSDPAVWARCHPAVGHTVELDALAQDRKSMGRAVWERSYLNVFQTSDKPRVLPELGWKAVCDEDATADPRWWAYDVAEDRSASAIISMGVDSEGMPTAEVVDYRPGSEWVAARVLDLRNRWGGLVGAAADGPPSTVTADLRDLGVDDVQLLDTPTMVTACAELLDTIVSAVRPGGEQRMQVRTAPVLDRAAASAAKRDVGDGWAWTRRRSGGDVSPIVALTVVHHLARHFVYDTPELDFAYS